MNFSKTSAVGMPHITLENDANYVGCYPVNGLILNGGKQIKNGQSITQYFQRKDINETVSISLDFKEGITVDPITIGASSGSNNNIPIGTIVASPLEPSKFLIQNGTANISDISKNIWAPCDGTSVSNSRCRN
ncbi:hypothetical protein ABS768_01730 [Flavobacterium sp. ST-75]|uniref:Uncharacterized protein n=1 Tax=Flavobacterium rhizophilum TaxID=3163296 RepID=A0ABW8Y888_9FLAO